MMKKYLLATAFLMGISSPALADECTDMFDRIELAMPTAALDVVTRSQVMGFYHTGMNEHNAGNHDAGVNALKQAMNLLGL